MKYERKLNTKLLFSNIVCVYTLYKNEEIVYIGQSKNLGNRINAHKRCKGGCKKFTHFSYVEIEKEHLNNVEAIFIYTHLPKYNKIMHKNDFVTHKEFIIKKEILK